MAPRFQTLDLRGTLGRLFVAGDVHGHFDLLDAALTRLGYRPGHDTLVLGGDLVDRGPRSHDVKRWVIENRARFIRGNHEWLTIGAATGAGIFIDNHKGRNGGDWFYDLSGDEQAEIAAFLADAPVALEIITPKGRRVGLVHANVPGGDWARMRADLEADGGMEYDCLWDRSTINDLERHARFGALADFHCTVAGIDRVYFGHTPIGREPVRHDNCVWIDTGAFSTGVLTVLDVDADIDLHG